MMLRPSNFSRGMRQAPMLALLFSIRVLWAQTNGSSSNDIPALRAPRPEIPPGWWELHGLMVAAAIPVALLALGVTIWLIRRSRAMTGQPPVVIATNIFLRLKAQPESGAVLSEISQTLRQYFGAVFGLPPAEMTTRDFCSELRGNGSIGPALVEEVSRFLRECDERKFAPRKESPPLGAAARALDLVAAAEKRRIELSQAQARMASAGKAQ